MTDFGPITIGAREVWDELVRLRASVEKLVTRADQDTERDRDVESRLRSLERWRWGLATATPVTGAVSALVTHALQ